MSREWYRTVKRSHWDDYFMDLARAAAKRSTCPRRQVGAILVRDNRVLSTGYNGASSGEPHCMDVGCDIVSGACVRTLHAESNAYKASSPRSRSGATLYSTDMPCLDCANLIARSGTIEVVFEYPYERTYDEVLSLFDYHCIVLRQHIPG